MTLLIYVYDDEQSHAGIDTTLWDSPAPMRFIPR